MIKRLVRYVLLFLLIAVPTVAIQSYALTRPEPAPFSEFEARLNYLTDRHVTGDYDVEVDLGYFNASIVRKEIDEVLRVRFRLSGVISRDDRRAFADFQETKINRFRDRVITLLTQTEASELTDPSMLALRSQLIGLANEMNEKTIFQNVMFSDYSVQKQ